MTERENDATESLRCAWPGCSRRVSDQRAFCDGHYRLIPAEDRGAAIKAVFAARLRARGREQPDGENA